MTIDDSSFAIDHYFLSPSTENIRVFESIQVIAIQVKSLSDNEYHTIDTSFFFVVSNYLIKQTKHTPLGNPSVLREAGKLIVKNEV